MEWIFAGCDCFCGLGEERCLFKLVFAVLGSCFTVYLCADRIEEEKKRSLTNGDLGLFNRFNFVHDSLLSLIGNNLGND